jgi:large subunit ribosomal protein L4
VRVSSLSRQFSSLNLPPNLTIADESVFAKPNDPVIPRREFYFPPLHVPETAPIKKFLDSKTGPIGEARLDRTVFGVAIRHDIVHEAVRYERHLFRQPHKSKRSFEISGSTKKPYAQKGTGKAQAGNKRASHWKGGQKAHGPKLRSFAIGMNKKQRALALMISLAAKQREGNLIIFDNFDVSVSTIASI